METRGEGYILHPDEGYCEITTWEGSVDCPKCGKKIGPYRWHGEKACVRAQMRKEARAKGRVLPIYVLVHGISRVYGGPEEGGWYYDWHTIHEVRKVWSFQAARQAIRELRDEYPKPRYNRYSVLGGEDMDVRVFMHEGEFPEETTAREQYC